MQSVYHHHLAFLPSYRLMHHSSEFHTDSSCKYTWSSGYFMYATICHPQLVIVYRCCILPVCVNGNYLSSCFLPSGVCNWVIASFLLHTRNPLLTSINIWQSYGLSYLPIFQISILSFWCSNILFLKPISFLLRASAKLLVSSVGNRLSYCHHVLYPWIMFLLNSFGNYTDVAFPFSLHEFW